MQLIAGEAGKVRTPRDVTQGLIGGAEPPDFGATLGAPDILRRGQAVSGFSRDELLWGYKILKDANIDPQEFVQRHGLGAVQELGAQRARGAANVPADIRARLSGNNPPIPTVDYKDPTGMAQGLEARVPSQPPAEEMVPRREFIERYDPKTGTYPEDLKVANWDRVPYDPGKYGKESGKLVIPKRATAVEAESLREGLSNFLRLGDESLPEEDIGGVIGRKSRTKLAKLLEGMFAKHKVGNENPGEWFVRMLNEAGTGWDKRNFAAAHRFYTLSPAEIAKGGGGERYLKNMLRPIISAARVPNELLDGLVKDADPEIKRVLEKITDPRTRATFLHRWVQENAQNPKQMLAMLASRAVPQDLSPEDYKAAFVTGTVPAQPARKKVQLGSLLGDVGEGDLKKVARARELESLGEKEVPTLRDLIKGMAKGPEKTAARKAYESSNKAGRAMLDWRKAKAAFEKASPELRGKVAEGGMEEVNQAVRALMRHKGVGGGMLPKDAGEMGIFKNLLKEAGGVLGEGKDWRYAEELSKTVGESRSVLGPLFKKLAGAGGKALPIVLLSLILAGGAGLLSRNREEA